MAATFAPRVLRGFSSPGGEKWVGHTATKEKATRAELEQELGRHNPVSRLAPLAKAGVPIFHIHGDADTVVPLRDNFEELARRYEKLGGKMEVKVATGQGHTVWDGFFRCQELVDFVLAHAAPAKTSK